MNTHVLGGLATAIGVFVLMIWLGAPRNNRGEKEPWTERDVRDMWSVAGIFTLLFGLWCLPPQLQNALLLLILGLIFLLVEVFSVLWIYGGLLEGQSKFVKACVFIPVAVFAIPTLVLWSIVLSGFALLFGMG